METIVPTVPSNIESRIAEIEEALKNPLSEPRIRYEDCPFCLFSIVRHYDYLLDMIESIYKELDKCVLKNIENPTDEQCREAVAKNGFEILYVKNRTPELCLLAVKYNSYLIRYIEHKYQSEEMALLYAKECDEFGEFFKYIAPQYQTDKVCLLAIETTSWAIEHFAEPKPEYCKAAVERNDVVFLLRQVQQNLSEETVMELIKKNPINIIGIDNPSEEQQLAAVTSDGLMIKHIKGSKSEKVCLAAVEQNPRALFKMKNRDRTPAVCLAAVKKDGVVLLCIKNQTPEMCRIAVAQNARFTKYVKDKSMITV
jgi:hypothetical protein